MMRFSVISWVMLVAALVYYYTTGESPINFWTLAAAYGVFLISYCGGAFEEKRW